MTPAPDLRGRRFGRLRVIGRADVLDDKHHHSWWHCDCDCGRRVIVQGASLVHGNTKSCGCYRHDVIRAQGLRRMRFSDKTFWGDDDGGDE